MNKLNIKITTEEERADYIKQLQEMEIEKPAQKWSEGGAIDGYYVNALSKIIPLNFFFFFFLCRSLRSFEFYTPSTPDVLIFISHISF